jgi:hypothetical protein
MAAPRFAELDRMTDDELKERHDALAGSTDPGLGYYLDELRRREFARQQMLMVIMTLANVVIASVAAAAALTTLLND